MFIKPKKYNTTVTQNVFLTHDVIDLQVALPENEEITFQAGQFMSVKRISEEGKTIQRAYSIFSDPLKKNTLGFNIKIVHKGAMSPHIGALEVGDKLELVGPFGHFLIDKNSTKPICFIATSVGLAPFYSMMIDLLNTNSTRPILLYFGFRHEKDIYWTNQLEDFKEKYSHFDYEISLSRPESEHWIGRTGRLTEVIKEDFENIKNHQFYLCGNGAMIDDVSHYLIENGVKKADVKFEKYYN